MSINKFVDLLVESKMEKKGGTLVLGDECSYRAGIPSAEELVEAIKKSHPQAYEKAKVKNLRSCAAQLTASQRAELFNFYLRKSKISWAHICVALLIKEGFIHRVYTTSPDPLLERACMLVGEFPMVYDCTMGAISKPELIPPKAIIHLNGQILGAVPGSLEGVFSGGAKNGPWLILGYNPDPKDPIYEQLSWLDEIHKGLLWVFSQNQSPPSFLQEHIFSKSSNYLYQSEDPDTFLVALIRSMKLSSTELISYPFTFLGQWLNKVAAYPSPGQKEGLNISDISLKQTKAAIQQYEGPERGSGIGDDEEAAGGVDDPELLKAIQAARTGLMSGNPQKVIEQHRQHEETPSIQLAQLLNWAYQVEGDTAFEEADKLFGQKALDKLKGAQTNYEIALQIRPDAPQTYFKLGNLLVEQTKIQENKDASGLLAQGAEHFKKALELNPDMFDAHFGLGNVFLHLAGEKEKAGKDSDKLYESASTHFLEALRIQPNNPEASYGAGHALFVQGRRKKGAEAVRLYSKSVESLKTALQGNPNRIEAILEMGQALFILSKTKRGEDADRYLMMAEEKFQQAVQINAELVDAQFGWADVLMERATLKNGATSDRFFNSAFQKYQEVLKLKPDMRRVDYRWGQGLLNMAQKKTGQEAVALLQKAVAKFKKALERNPKSMDLLNRMGRVYFELGNHHEGTNAETLYSQAMDYLHKVLKLQPKNFEAMSHVGNIYYMISMHKQGREAENLLQSSIEKYQEALKVKPDYHKAIMLWGNSIFRLATLKLDGTCEELYDQAEKKYEQALKIHPDDATALGNFGAILLKRAQKEKSDKAETILKKAIKCFQSSIEIRDDNYETLNAMGEALIAQAKSKRGVEAHPLLAEAKGMLQKAEEFHPGAGCYNLARLQAQLANETGCRQWLERCKEHDVLPDADILNKEILFTSVKDSKWFKNLLTAKAPEAGEKKEEKPVEKEIAMPEAKDEPALPSDK